jgi:hypothetical protein
MKKILFVLSILAALLAFTVIISCNEYPMEIKPVLIEEGYTFGSGKRGNLVIKTQAELDHLIDMHCSQYDESAFAACYQDFTEKINFDKSQIIAVIDGIRPQVGWSVNIVSIREYSDNIVVSIYVKAPKGLALDALTRPYQIVKIPVTEKDVVFRYVNYTPPLCEEGKL